MAPAIWKVLKSMMEPGALPNVNTPLKAPLLENSQLRLMEDTSQGPYRPTTRGKIFFFF
jgi:hypothetical protein